MNKLFALVMMLSVFVATDAHSQPGYCDCYGGIDENGNHWQLLDYHGNPLEDGDWVYAAWTGPDGKIDPPDINGHLTGDDVLLPIAAGQIEYSSFFITVATWKEGFLDTLGNQRHPMDGDLIYCRIFDGPEGAVSPHNYYADSQIHEVEWKLGDEFFCLFPGDPGHGHTSTPLPTEKPAAVTPAEQVPTALQLRQNYPNLLSPVTEITYAIPRAGHVTLKVYDLAGAEVATLVDAHQKAGVYTVRWDAQELASGIYFCRLQAGDFSKTVKMVHFL